MDFVTLEPSSLSAETNDATYFCALNNKWSGETHPVLYDGIESTAHWSSPVLVTHAPSYQLWADGELASPGVERVAEMGATDTIRNEILSAQTSGLVGDWDIGMDQFNDLDRSQTFGELLLTPDFPFLSSITMMAPSSDWFTGIPGFSPIDKIDGVWYEFFEVATYPWDAGTETGNAYSLNNGAEDPHKPISQLTVDTVPENDILLDPSGKTVLPVATWSCLLQEKDINNNENIDNIDIMDVMDDISNGSCRKYLQMCIADSDCCSRNCVRGVCRGRDRKKQGRGRESLRLSRQGRNNIGGAAGRDPRSSSMIADGKAWIDEIRAKWLRGSDEMNS